MADPLLAQHRQPRDSLATKIIFFVFVSTFVTALVVSWISVHSTYSFLRTHLDHSYPAILTRSAADLGGWLSDGEALVERLASRRELQRVASGAQRDRDRAAVLLAEALHEGREPLLGAFALSDATGTLLLGAGASDETAEALGHLTDAGDAPAFRAIGSLLAVSAPLRDAEGARVGTLLAAFSPLGLANRLGGQVVAGTGVVYLVDSKGRSLAAAPATAAPPFEVFPPGLLARAADGRAFEFRNAEGRRGIGAHHDLAGTPWSLVVAQPLESAFAPVFSVVTRIFAIDLGIILLFSFLAYEITAAIVRPLEALSDGARRISQGELEVEIPDTGTHDEIGLLTRTFDDMARRLRRNRAEIEQQHQQLREQNDQLQRANEVLEQLSITDGLTKLHNHRYFQETLTREIKRVSRTREPLAMLLIDIDDFKALNDRLGHAEGDALLVRIARILNESVRESDVLARYGGEEFVVLATGTDREGAIFVAEKVRTAVAEAWFGPDDASDPMRVTISIGVAEYQGERRIFFDAADRALYRAKAAGKNCVVSAEPSGTPA
jgi:diguanylate cyclase (GGDEF)-like protein